MQGIPSVWQEIQSCILKFGTQVKIQLEEAHQTGQIPEGFFCRYLHDELYILWLARELGIGGVKEFQQLLECATKNSKLGRPTNISQDNKIEIQEHWKYHTVIRVDGGIYAIVFIFQRRRFTK